MRSNLEIGKEGFPIYQEKQLRKINAMRRAASVVGIDSSETPVLDKSQMQYVTAEEMDNKPCSCYHCTIYNQKAETCGIMGPRIPVKKFIWPKEATADAKQIEYWPACGAADPGEPNSGDAKYKPFPYRDPDLLGFGWINAPKPGLSYSGANCGGANDGDDCDFYLTEDSVAKWDAPIGFCRVSQSPVANGDVCACWQDDDWISWQKGMELLRG